MLLGATRVEGIGWWVNGAVLLLLNGGEEKAGCDRVVVVLHEWCGIGGVSGRWEMMDGDADGSGGGRGLVLMVAEGGGSVAGFMKKVEVGGFFFGGEGVGGPKVLGRRQSTTSKETCVRTECLFIQKEARQAAFGDFIIRAPYKGVEQPQLQSPWHHTELLGYHKLFSNIRSLKIGDAITDIPASFVFLRRVLAKITEGRDWAFTCASTLVYPQAPPLPLMSDSSNPCLSSLRTFDIVVEPTSTYESPIASPVPLPPPPPPPSRKSSQGILILIARVSWLEHPLSPFRPRFVSEALRDPHWADGYYCCHVHYPFHCSAACAFFTALQHGRCSHGYLIVCGFALDTSICKALNDMYAKCGRIDFVREVFNRMAKRDIILWNAMIAGYGIHGLGREALLLYHDLQNEGPKPDCVTFICLLLAYNSQTMLRSYVSYQLAAIQTLFAS
ncbi:hypothetical protein IFM89_029014 [Coptis chinensis]|uniref:Pentatricopeptide repeat-containing protein n=1 Tax=Coptis chinensis TaxID=261450 RepID=A0A835M1J5_9MAGN|nr:hypothetical protein IFM89_029014 [Coptis chinensis]